MNLKNKIQRKTKHTKHNDPTYSLVTLRDKPARLTQDTSPSRPSAAFSIAVSQPTTSLGDRNKEILLSYFSLALPPDSRAGNVLINSKLQHPPGQPPWHLNF